MSLRNMIRTFSDERWAIGFFRNSLDELLNGAHPSVDWVKDHDRNRWFADPFILSADNNTIVVLAEEVNKSYKNKRKGRISRLEISRAEMRIIDVCPILELDTHLSFPAIIRKDKQVLIYPENGESGKLTLYSYDDANRTCTPTRVICDDAIEDAVITDSFDQLMMFATKRYQANGSTLTIYTQQGKNQEFIESESYQFTENVARMAGHFIQHDGKVIRPTQECNIQYGHAITLQEVRHDENGWHFDEIRRIYSTHPKLVVGTHTFNVYNDLIATDALGFDRMWFRRCLKFLGLL